MLKAIIFDAYGTLFDTGTGSVDAAARILCKCGRTDLEPRKFYARWKQIHRMHLNSHGAFRTEREIYHEDLICLYSEYGIKSAAEQDIEIMLDVQGTRIAYPETREVLEALYGKYTLCIGSTTDTAPLMQDIARAGITMDYIFTSESMRVYKPFPEFYATILNEIGVAHDEAIFVGDSLLDDVKGPQSAGMRACWINRRGEVAGDCSPDCILPDLRGVIEFAEAVAQRLRA
ncbi:MAG: HAD-IA family hydrolase [Clostridia bacterium]|nr:HAD-IA family hydrolase [Clostridia bacterium]